jgi:hypothetical protein
MWGVLLTGIGTFFEEVGTSLGKTQVSERRYGIYSLGWIQSSASALFFLILSLVHRQAFYFSAASIPFFGLRILLEVTLAHLSCLAVIKAERSTFSFIRTGTIPLLLIIDAWGGYRFTLFQIIGIGIIITTLGLFFLTRTLNSNGAGLTILCTILAAATISLYKYTITHYNSVAADQLLISIPIILYFSYSALFRAHERPWHFLTQPQVIVQVACGAITGLAGNYAYVFAPASVIVAARRSTAVLWSIISGKMYFKEQKILFKLGIVVLLSIGIIAITISA